MAKTFYDILGLTPRATSREISDAYRNIVREHHPDRFAIPEEKAEAETLLKLVTEAYNTLSRPNLRQAYDKEFQGAGTSEVVKKSPQEQAKEFFQQALARQHSDPNGALTLFDFVLKLTPEDSEALFRAGMIRLLSPKWRVQGVQQVEAAIQKSPFTAHFFTDYARFLIGSGQVLRAEKIVTQALEFHAGDPNVQDLLSQCQGDAKPQPSGFGLFGKKK